MEINGKKIQNKAKEELLWAGIEGDYLDYFDLFENWENKQDLTNFLLFLLIREKKIIPSFEDLIKGNVKINGDKK
ncbi:MAG: hypothetical protein AABY22_01570 [Nanoarchaeota archaeon]